MCSPSQLYKLPSKFAQAVSVPVNQHSGSKLAMMLVATIFVIILFSYPPSFLGSMLPQYMALSVCLYVCYVTFPQKKCLGHF